MTWLRLNALAVGSMTTTLLLGAITCYLLMLRGKGRETWWLTGYLGSLFLLLLAYTARYSIFSCAALATGQISNLIVFGVACLIQFAYWFGGNPYPRESRVALGLSCSAGAEVENPAPFLGEPPGQAGVGGGNGPHVRLRRGVTGGDARRRAPGRRASGLVHLAMGGLQLAKQLAVPHSGTPPRRDPPSEPAAAMGIRVDHIIADRQAADHRALPVRQPEFVFGQRVGERRGDVTRISWHEDGSVGRRHRLLAPYAAPSARRAFRRCLSVSSAAAAGAAPDTVPVLPGRGGKRIAP